MSVGRLAAVNVSAGVNTLIYTVPAKSINLSATVNICNKNKYDVDVRLAIVDGGVGDLTDADDIEDVTIRAKGGIERAGIDLKPGQSIVGYSDKGNVTFQVWA